MPGDVQSAEKDLVRGMMVEALEKELNQLRIAYEEARQASIEAPGRMVSRYDTMGVEAAYRADGLAPIIADKSEALRALKSLKLPASPQRISLGCLVEVSSAGGQSNPTYFLVPSGGGLTLTAPMSHRTVVAVSSGSPVARVLIGKQLDDEVVIRPGERARLVVRID